MREFVTAVAVTDPDAEERQKQGWIDFTVTEIDKEGKVIRKVPCAAKRPSPGQIAYLTASLHKKASEEQQIAGAINFCMAIMDQETGAYLAERLLDNSDPFELPQIQKIIEGLVEEWSGKASDESSTSSSTPEPSGSTSTESVLT